MNKGLLKKIGGFLGFGGFVVLLSGAAWLGGYKQSMDDEKATIELRMNSLDGRMKEVESEQRIYREKVIVYMAATDEKLSNIIKQLEK